MPTRRKAKRRRKAQSSFEAAGTFSEILAGGLALIGFLLKGSPTALTVLAVAGIQVAGTTIDFPTMLLILSALLAVGGVFAFTRRRR